MFEYAEAGIRREYEGQKPAVTWDEACPASQAAWNKFTQAPRDTSIDTFGNPRKG